MAVRAGYADLRGRYDLDWYRCLIAVEDLCRKGMQEDKAYGNEERRELMK